MLSSIELKREIDELIWVLHPDEHVSVDQVAKARYQVIALLKENNYGGFGLVIEELFTKEKLYAILEAFSRED